MKPLKACVPAIALIMGAGALASGAALAQAQGQPQGQETPPSATTPDATEPAAQIPEEKIEQFANAFAEIQAIQSEATQKLESTTDNAAADRVMVDAETQMVAAVKRSGLQIEEFNRIAELMTSDISVRARVAEKLQQRRGG